MARNSDGSRKPRGPRGANKPETGPAPPPAPGDAWSPLFAVVADVHVHNHARHGGPMVDGLNNRGRETVAVLRRAVAAARAAGCRALFVAGDLSHVRRPDPAITAAIQGVLRDAGDLDRYVVPGNHDMLDASAAGGNTACAPLEDVAHVVNAPFWTARMGDVSVLCVPFDATRPMADHLEEVLPRMVQDRPLGDGPCVLVAHVGVFDAEGAAPWQLRAKGAISAQRLLYLLEQTGFSQAFVGDYHNHASWCSGPSPAPAVVQVGTLCPASHSDPSINVGSVVMSDGRRWRRDEVPGPRFVSHGTSLEGVKFPAENTYYVRLVSADPPPKEDLPANVCAVDWVPLQASPAAASSGPAALNLTPEEALRAACDSLEQEELRGPVLELVEQAWSRGA